MSRVAKKSSLPLKARSAPAKGILKRVPFKPAPQEFVSSFYEYLLPTDLAAFTVEERARIAASIWRFAEIRRPNEDKVRVFNPSPDADGWTVDHTVVEIICTDMPFEVDSITGVLQNRGLAIHLVIHPIIYTRRDAKHRAIGVGRTGDKDVDVESFMHIQIDHCIEADQLKEIEKELRATLSDVYAAVEDWQKMRGRMLETAELITSPQAVVESGDDADEVKDFLRWLCDDNFTFLGYREIDLQTKNKDTGTIRIVSGKGLGVLRDDQVRMFGKISFSSSPRLMLSHACTAFCPWTPYLFASLIKTGQL
jgi:glutamate dehydrogenase